MVKMVNFMSIFPLLKIKNSGHDRYLWLTSILAFIFYYYFYYLKDRFNGERSNWFWFGHHISVCLPPCWLISISLRATLCKCDSGRRGKEKDWLAPKLSFALGTTLIQFLSESQMSFQEGLLSSAMVFKHRDFRTFQDAQGYEIWNEYSRRSEQLQSLEGFFCILRYFFYNSAWVAFILR